MSEVLPKELREKYRVQLKNFKLCVYACKMIEEVLTNFEAFVANFNKALQSKDLAYKTMEKAYIDLSKKLDGLRKLRNDLDKTFDDEVELVRKVCLNVLRQPLYGGKLQKVVIYHMKNYKAKLDRRLDEAL